MSTNHSTTSPPGEPTTDTASEPALGSRDNWWGDDTDEDVSGGHSEASGTDAAEQLARRYALRFEEPICTRTRDEPGWNGGRLAELVAWLCDDECIDGRGHQLHNEQTTRGLTGPVLPMPRQFDAGSRIIEYGAHRCRRRYNPETGYINWGETTGTGIPEFDHDTYQLCVDTYLAERGVRITQIDEYLEYAEQVWCDPSMGSKDSLEQFIRYVRDEEQGD
jgi:hypothetical protein